MHRQCMFFILSLSIVIAPVNFNHGSWSCCASQNKNRLCPSEVIATRKNIADWEWTLVSGWAMGKMREITHFHYKWKTFDSRFGFFFCWELEGKELWLQVLMRNFWRARIARYLLVSIPGSRDAKVCWNLLYLVTENYHFCKTECNICNIMLVFFRKVYWFPWVEIQNTKLRTSILYQLSIQTIK